MTYDCSHREKTHLQSRMIFVSTACHAPNIDPETSTTGHLDRHLAQLIWRAVMFIFPGGFGLPQPLEKIPKDAFSKDIFSIL